MIFGSKPRRREEGIVSWKKGGDTSFFGVGGKGEKSLEVGAMIHNWNSWKCKSRLSVQNEGAGEGEG